MKCRRVRDSLMDYISADLPPGELQSINEHLMGCEECRTALAIARRASSALSMLGSESPVPSLVGAVRDKIVRDRLIRRPVLLPRLAVGFSAAALVALCIAGWLRYGAVEPSKVAKSPIQQTPVTAPRDTNQAMPPVVGTIAEPALALRAAGPSGVGRKSPSRLADPGTHGEQTANPERMTPEPDADSEPVILIAVQPKETEIYVMHLDADEQDPSTELTVVRQFDGGGNITSVSIEGKSSTDDTGETIIPGLDRTELLDAPPNEERSVGYRYAGGSNSNA